MARLVLFGSQARGEATQDSDVDILVVIDDLSSADAREIDAVVGVILTRTDLLLQPLVLSAARFDELRARERRLVAETVSPTNWLFAMLSFQVPVNDGAWAKRAAVAAIATTRIRQANASS